MVPLTVLTMEDHWDPVVFLELRNYPIRDRSKLKFGRGSSGRLGLPDTRPFQSEKLGYVLNW